VIRIEPVVIAQDRYGPVYDVFVVNAKGKQLRAYYGVSQHVLRGVVDAVGHCNKLSNKKAREALLQKELPDS
jgi:hypothetical protein